MSVLFYKVMRYSVSEPKHPANDRFILSKGHAAPILYAAWAEVEDTVGSKLSVDTFYTRLDFFLLLN